MIRQEKQMLRSQMRETMAELSATERALASKKIRRRLEEFVPWGEARVVYGFFPMASEPDWLGEVWPADRVIVLPRIDKGVMRFFPAGAVQELRPGAFGIPEPVAELPAPPPDIAIIPGLAFDAQGFRLGRGRGFYDRFLEQIPHVPVIGVCFTRQLVERIPTELHDAKVNTVITEDRVIAP